VKSLFVLGAIAKDIAKTIPSSKAA
jgi:hypothetical protein